MAKLKLMRDGRDFTIHKVSVWENAVGEGTAPLSTFSKFPCLVKVVPIRYSFHLEAMGILTVICTKEEAKRIVYPRTNKNRSRTGFTVIEGDLKDAMDNYVADTIEHTNQLGRMSRINVAHPTQCAMINKAMSELDGVSGLVLVTSRVYTNLDKLRLIDFYVVDEADAHKLVYLNKGPSTKLKKLYPGLKYQRPKAKSVERHIQELKSSFNRFTREYEIMHHNNSE